MQMVYNSFHCIKALAFSAAEEQNIRFERKLCLLKTTKTTYGIYAIHGLFCYVTVKSLCAIKTEILGNKNIQMKVKQCESHCNRVVSNFLLGMVRSLWG